MNEIQESQTIIQKFEIKSPTNGIINQLLNQKQFSEKFCKFTSNYFCKIGIIEVKTENNENVQIYYLNSSNDYYCLEDTNFEANKLVKKQLKFAKVSEFKNNYCQILKQNELTFPQSGYIIQSHQIYSRLLLETQIDPILLIKPCKHDMVYESMCCHCGEKISQASLPKDHTSLAIATGNSSHLQFSIDRQKEIEEQFTTNLWKNKKLLLILDLDNTLIHASVCSNQRKLEQSDSEVVEFYLPFQPFKYIVKFRPYLKYFCEKISENYEFYIYTMGTRLYAETVCKYLNKLLDPNKVQINKNQIISRDDNFNSDMKSLKRILPFNDKLVLILDDKEDVWKNQKNLVHTFPFYYFNEREIIKPVINGNTQIVIKKNYDNFLYFCANNLEIIHKTFYNLAEKIKNADQLDASEIYQFLMRSIFHDQTFVLSGIVDYSKPIDANKIYLDAKRRGAKIITDFDENNKITCLITNQYRPTKKMKQAKSLQIPIIHYYYIYFCKLYQCNLLKDTFDLTKKLAYSLENQEEIEKVIVQDNAYNVDEIDKVSLLLVAQYLQKYQQ